MAPLALTVRLSAYVEALNPSLRAGEELQSSSSSTFLGEGAGGCSLLPTGWANRCKTVRRIDLASANQQIMMRVDVNRSR